MKQELPQLSLSIIESLKKQGLSQSEIAREWGVTRQDVSWHKTTYGGQLTPREIALKAWPFKVPQRLTQTMPYRRLRDHGEYMATGGKGMSADKLNRLRTFYRRLRDENAVLEFDPSIPPIPGLSNRGGWAFRDRLPADEDFLIRVNEFTNLTEEGDTIWRFPPRDP